MACAVIGETMAAMQFQAAEVARIIQETGDLEFAFQMQLEEAISVSASLSQASGSSTFSHEDSEYSDAWTFDEDRQVAVTEQGQEMGRLTQEMEDEVEALREQSRLAELVATCEHDSRFARFLASVPMSEWDENGRNLTDPFTYTRSLDGSLKDMVGAQRLNSMDVDTNVASTSLLCQSDMWEPAVAAALFLDTVNPLNKSCFGTVEEGFLVERSCSSSERATCTICMETVMHADNSLVVAEDCAHRFCTECLRRHAETAVTMGKSYVNCPQYSCEQLFSGKMSEILLSSNSLFTITQRQIEDAFPQSERVYCPFQNCSALLLRPALSIQPSSSSHPHLTAVGGVECFSCNRYFCLECQVPWHGDLSCEEFQNLPSDERAAEDLQFKGLAKAKKWQKCNNCGFVVELKGGCHHISCLCGNNFCYTCGERWASGHICQTS